MTSAQAFFDLSQGPHSSNHSETSSEESDLDEQPNEKRRRDPGLRFKLLKFFRTLEEYKNWWNTEKEKVKWVYHSAHQNKNHLVEKWFCPFVERKDYACTSRLKISFSDADESVTVEITTDGHNHEPKAGTSKLTDAVKKRIAELADQGTMPKRIHFLLSQEGLAELPEYTQLRDYVHNRRPTRKQEPFTDRQLASYCEKNITAPVSPDEPGGLRGTKKRVCKHAVLIMCEAAKVAQFPPAATAKPLVNSRRKKPTEGRPPLAAPQNRHAIA